MSMSNMEALRTLYIRVLSVLEENEIEKNFYFSFKTNNFNFRYIFKIVIFIYFEKLKQT